MEARRSTSNPIPRKINEVFAALERQEFGIEGEFSFLKIPFLYLVSKFRIGPLEARRALQAMSEPGLFDQMSPFLKVLTQKAYDLVLTARVPLPTETTTQLIEGFETHAKDLSLRQWWLVLTALPGRMIWGAVVGIVALGLVPILFGFGSKLADLHRTTAIRTLPSELAVTSIEEAGPELPLNALLLVRALQDESSVRGKHTLQVVVKVAPFTNLTPPFAVEVSHADRPILNVLAFSQPPNTNTQLFTVLPVQRDSGRFRAILPAQEIGQRVCFVLILECGQGEDVGSVGRGVILRPLQ